MNEELEEQLYKNHPILFENNEIPIEIGDGWFTIIDTLCACLCKDFDKIHKEILFCTDEIRADQLRAKLEVEKDRLPLMVQVKEKFGDLRIYYSRTSESAVWIEALVSFAEEMCSRTCNSCGKPGRKIAKEALSVVCNGCRSKSFKV